MRIVFMGTPEFAATILEDLIQHHEVVAVYTRPDAIRGRGKIKEASPVKLLAEKHAIPVYTPLNLRDEAVQKHLMFLAPDFICVAAYGVILPKEVLLLPQYACLNVHASLLPKWRGAAPVERAILAGDEETGVCIMRMEEGLDTGDYCVCRTTSIEDKNTLELSDELANLGSYALLTALIHVQEGVSDWIKQDEAHASYAPKIKKGELNISPQDTAHDSNVKVHASSPAHPSRCVVAGRSLTVLKTRLLTEDSELNLSKGLEAGAVRLREKRLFFGTAEGAIEILSVKPDGKSSMDAKAFAAGVQNIKEDTTVWSALNG